MMDDSPPTTWGLYDCVLSLGCLDFGIQWFLWIFSAILHTEKFYDLAGSCTFIVLVCLAYQWSPTQSFVQYVQTGMVVVWALRLGLFLFVRVLKEGGDRRFSKARDSAVTLLVYWTLQGVWVLVTLLPTLVLLCRPARRSAEVSTLLGWTLWLVGFVMESAADYQKSVFRNDPANEGKFISSGLWSLSRHPNYLGEMLLWFGLYLSMAGSLRGWQHLLVLCPLFDTMMITRLSGVPLLEASARRRWGHDPQYKLYTQTVPCLVPWIGST